MAVRREGKITAGEAFADGFREGYKSRMGANADLPEVPVAPAGALDHTDGHSARRHDAALYPYLSGVAQGVAAGLERKPVCKPST
jgi:hypothetical protein